MVLSMLVASWPLAAAVPVFVGGLALLAVAGGIAAYFLAERPILRVAQAWRGK